MINLPSHFFKDYLPELIVSRETISQYETYFHLLTEWNKVISLVQEKTLDDFLVRHIIDSLQIVPLMNMDSKIVDLGTGAGFPGLALAVYGFKNITLVESNRKKTVFLGEVSRQTQTPIKILNERAEQIKDKYDFILSRACSSLSNLLSLMKNVSRETSTGVFHKGETYLTEIEEAQLNWTFDYELKDSVTDRQSKIIIVRNIGKKYG